MCRDFWDTSMPILSRLCVSQLFMKVRPLRNLFTVSNVVGQSYVFTGFCDSVHTGVCILACTGADASRWTPRGQTTPWADTPLLDRHPSTDGHCSGRYASNWNAFLFGINSGKPNFDGVSVKQLLVCLLLFMNLCDCLQHIPAFTSADIDNPNHHHQGL